MDTGGVYRARHGSGDPLRVIYLWMYSRTTRVILRRLQRKKQRKTIQQQPKWTESIDGNVTKALLVSMSAPVAEDS